MLTLRVLRGSGPTVLGRWLLVAAASAGTGLLLLSALGWALAHPGGSSSHSVVRLAWCLVPIAATVQLAVAVGRAQPAGWPRTGLAAVGLGRTAVVLLAAATAAIACSLGSAVALGLFLELRGDVTGVPWDGVGPGLLAAGRPLPAAGAVTLLALVPLAAACACALRLRPERPVARDIPRALPWGVALIAVGLAAELAAPSGHELPLPSGMGSLPSMAVAGWIVTAAGMVLAGPGTVYACGRLLVAFRPGAVRLLAGRSLQYEARCVGHPLGLLAATGAAGLAAYHGARPVGPVTAFAVALIAVCVLATAAVTLTEPPAPPRGGALRAVAVSPATLRAALAVRAAVLVAALVPATVLIAALSTHP